MRVTAHYIIIAASTAVLAAGPAWAQPHQSAPDAQAQSVQPQLDWAAWDAWNRDRKTWVEPVNHLVTDFLALQLHLQQGAPTSATAPAVEAWRSEQMAAYRALVDDAQRLRGTPPPPPDARIATNALTRIVAPADREYLEGATSAVLAAGDDIRKLIDLDVRASQADPEAAAAAARQKLVLQIRQFDLNMAEARPSFSLPDDPSRDFADWQIDVDHGLIALLQAAVAGLAPKDEIGAAPVDRGGSAAQIRVWAAKAERSVAKQSADVAAKLAQLNAPFSPDQQARADGVRATMVGFQQIAGPQADVIAALRQSAQTLETPESSPGDWLTSFGGVMGLYANVAGTVGATWKN